MRSLFKKGLYVSGIVFSLSLSAQAQYMGGAYWGTGMYGGASGCNYKVDAVSYTHLTLPTIYSV